MKDSDRQRTTDSIQEIKTSNLNKIDLFSGLLQSETNTTIRHFNPGLGTKTSRSLFDELPPPIHHTICNDKWYHKSRPNNALYLSEIKTIDAQTLIRVR